MFRLKKSSILLALAAWFFVINFAVFAPTEAKAEVVLNIAVPTFESVAIQNKKLLINGFSSPETKIELLNGARQFGLAETDENGHFSIAISLKLATGQYQLVLRSTEKTGHSATSIQNLVLTMSHKSEQKILAMLEEPGKPRRLIFDGENPVAPDLNQVEQSPLIDFVLFDQGMLTVSGRAKSQIIFITIDNKRVAMVKVGEDGRFFASRSLMLLAGDHIVSVNQIDENGDVTSIARKPFQVKVGNSNSTFIQSPLNSSDAQSK